VIFFHRRLATPFKFFHTKRHGDIPTGPPPLTGASNAGEVGKNLDSHQYLASWRVVNDTTA